jgi:DNA-binding transcriptional regulator YdaS (Cro superfamily)
MKAMDRIRATPGLMAKIAHELDITRAAVAKWDEVPVERVPAVEQITGIPRHELRPSHWLPPVESAPSAGKAA